MLHADHPVLSTSLLAEMGLDSSIDLLQKMNEMGSMIEKESKVDLSLPFDSFESDEDTASTSLTELFSCSRLVLHQIWPNLLLTLLLCLLLRVTCYLIPLLMRPGRFRVQGKAKGTI
ncbi:unnamed protein product [Protopolystoma xenopodis]|uniref:Uncharacterized protein n=1 Tax=Protopolystoma xenopodis TaxID=117903 RepID=A0A3S5A240_9PLAT|nr:unnamed protein product [Protopolystoma xenopodis]